MFLHCAIAYIITLLISIVLIDSYILNALILCFLCFGLFAYYTKKYNPSLNIYYPVLFFICAGLFNICLFNQFNKNILLEKDSGFITLYGEVYNIQNTSYEAKNHVFLTNLISKQESNLPKNVRLTYKGDDLNIGDIIKINAFLFSTRSKIYPNGLNLGYSAIAKKIGAYGFIVGQAEVIRSNYNYNIYDKLIFKIKEFKTTLINNIRSYDLKNFGFLIAITLGKTDWIPKSDLIAMQISALAHLISISGYHISIIGGFIFFTIRFGLSVIPNLALIFNLKKISAFFTIIILISYLFLLEFPIPATRATIMIIALMISILLNFKAFSLNSLFLACIMILSINPYYIFSAGFLLSAIATMSIILFVNHPLIKLINKKKYDYNILIRICILLGLSMLLTLFIELTIAPILAFYFGYLPIFGMFSNVLAGPIFSFIIMPAMMIYFLTPSFIGIYFIKLADIAIEYLLDIARFVANQKYTSITTQFFPDYIVVLILIGYLIMVGFNNKKVYIGILTGYLLIISFYTIFNKNPDILIDNNFDVIAIYYNNSYMVSNKNNKFIIQAWLKNEDKENLNDLYTNINCEQNHCIFNIKNKKIIVARDSKLLNEDCGYADLIIIQSNAPFLCKNITIIDNSFIKKYSTTFININNKINIYTAQ